MKKFIKYLLGFIYCLLFRAKYQKGIYIGIGSKLMGANLHLAKSSKIMPQAMLVSLRGGKIENR